MLLSILAIFAGIFGPIVTLLYAKRLLIQQKDALIDEIFDILGSEEGQQSIATVGAIFGKGLQAGLGLKGALKPQGKIFGLPASIVGPLIQRFLPAIIGEEKSPTETPISQDTTSKGKGGKFG